MKNILYLLLFLFPVLGYSQIFVAEFDNIVSGTPSVGTYSMLGVFSDNDGYGQTTDSVNTSGIHYFIDAGGQEYVIVAKSGSSPFTIEVNPLNGAGVPELGIGQLTSKTNNQYHMTAAVGDLTRTKILNLNIQAGGGGSNVDSASYANDTLYLFLEGATIAQTKVSPAITTFNLNGTNLELELANGGQATVDLAAVAGTTAPPILRQSSEPTSPNQFWKDTDGDTSRVKAPFADQGYKDLAYYDDIMSVTTNTYQGKAVLDTVPLLAGIDQTRLDSMNLIGITSTPTGWSASTAARDSLYPDAFAIAIHNTDSMIIAYSGVLVFPDSVFEKGKNYYQPYEYKKYQTSPDSILEQLVFKAVDTNVIEIRDRYSYLAENRLQSERSIPIFNLTIESFTSQTLIMEINMNPANYTITGGKTDFYLDPISGVDFEDYNGGFDFVENPSGNYLLGNNTGYLETVSFSDIPADTVFTIVLGFDNAGLSTSDWFYGKRQQPFPNTRGFYSQSGLYKINAGDVVTNLGGNGTGRKICVINWNPTTGAQYILEGQSSFTTTSPYVEGANWSGLRLGNSSVGATTNILNSGAKIYGLYMFTGNATLQEALDMINNWNLYHRY